MTVLNEDSIYRASSQFRLWSFTPETLSSLRSTANDNAATHIRKRRRVSHTTTTSSSTSTDPSTYSKQGNTEPPTPMEELQTLNQLILPQLTHITTTYFHFLPNLERFTSTASQYLRRYYLTHSVTQPPPSQASFDTLSSAPPTSMENALSSETMTVLSALFLSIKLHDLSYPLEDFVSRVRDKGGREGLKGAENLTIDGLKRAEGEMTRTLRFCFEVRHPGQGVRGLEVDLHGLLVDEEGMNEGRRRKRLRRELLGLPPPPPAPAEATEEEEADARTSDGSVEKPRKRIKRALQRAMEILNTTVHTTDVYFIHTPSQILFAVLMVADEPLAEWYLGSKFPSPTPSATGANGNDEEAVGVQENDAIYTLRDKVFTTIHSCAETLRTASTKASVSQEKLHKLKERLRACQALLAAPAASATSNGAGAATEKEENNEETSETSRTSVKRNGTTAGLVSSSSEEEEDEDDDDDDDDDDDIDGPGTKRVQALKKKEEKKKKKKKRRRRIEDDDVFGGPL